MEQMEAIAYSVVSLLLVVAHLCRRVGLVVEQMVLMVRLEVRQVLQDKVLLAGMALILAQVVVVVLVR
jgi:hypothetical protein